MKKIKLFLSDIIKITLTTSLFLIPTGCIFSDSKQGPSVDAIVDHMSDKYNMPFTYVKEYEVLQDSYDILEVWLQTPDYPDDLIFAYMNTEEYPVITYGDNLLNVKYKDETYDYAKNIISQVYPDIKYLDYEVSTDSSPELNPDASFEDYIHAKSTSPYIIALLPPDYDVANSENDMIRLYNICKENKISINLDIDVALSDEIYNDINSTRDTSAHAGRYRDDIKYEHDWDWAIYKGGCFAYWFKDEPVIAWHKVPDNKSSDSLSDLPS